MVRIEMTKAVLALFTVCFFSGCSSIMQESHYENELEAVRIENHQFRKDIESMQAEIDTLTMEEKQADETLIAEEFSYNGGLQYEWLDEEESRRYVRKELDLLALPYEGAPVINRIEPNTLFQVHDKVSVNNEIENGAMWYYISIPTYDAPMDYKGWVHAEDTFLYDMNAAKKLQGDVTVPAGSVVIDSYEFPNFNGNVYEETLISDIKGRISGSQDGYI